MERHLSLNVTLSGCRVSRRVRRVAGGPPYVEHTETALAYAPSPLASRRLRRACFSGHPVLVGDREWIVWGEVAGAFLLSRDLGWVAGTFDEAWAPLRLTGPFR